MATDPRAALDRLVAAFEAHLEAARINRDPDAEPVLTTAGTLADAFDTYDDALFTAYGVDTPFDVYDDEEEDDDEGDEDEDGDSDEDYDDEDFDGDEA
ncbi:DNA primase [Miniimonas arenae]|uniref:DNA primase n=1 Tax=Miniimonas arenae TaxID=676201 RepID=A0A5C5BET0_9MICO|nr:MULTISPECIES: DNA primase [Miniimonas]TNU77051.1 DNA primase [Miniimonas arenae]